MNASSKKIFLNLFILFLPLLSFSQDSLFNKANALYSKEDYYTAIEQYEKIIASDIISSELFYNLGNAYYKTGQIAPAILNYEKALRLNPKDKNIRYNLKIANEQTVDRIEQISGFRFSIWLSNSIDIFSSNAWAYISVFTFISCLFFIFLFLFSSRISLKKFAFFFTVFLAICTVFSFFAAKEKKNKLLHQREAVIFTPSVTIYSTPSTTGTELFLLHAGTKVKIIENIGTWYRIQIADGNDGWIEEKNFKFISVF